MTHDEAYQQIAQALPYLDCRLSNKDGVLYLNGEVHFILENGKPTKLWRAQRLLITDKPHEQMDWGKEWREGWQAIERHRQRKFDPNMWDGLNARAYTAVCRLKPEQYSDLTRDMLMRVNNVGKVTVNHIEEFLNDKGYKLL